MPFTRLMAAMHWCLDVLNQTPARLLDELGACISCLRPRATWQKHRVKKSSHIIVTFLLHIASAEQNKVKGLTDEPEREKVNQADLESQSWGRH